MQITSNYNHVVLHCDKLNSRDIMDLTFDLYHNIGSDEPYGKLNVMYFSDKVCGLKDLSKVELISKYLGRFEEDKDLPYIAIANTYSIKVIERVEVLDGTLYITKVDGSMVKRTLSKTCYENVFACLDEEGEYVYLIDDRLTSYPGI
ncbi:MAG: hypothetical protein R3Y64_10470 [Peptostreptococcaceae bacterium]